MKLVKIHSFFDDGYMILQIDEEYKTVIDRVAKALFGFDPHPYLDRERSEKNGSCEVLITERDGFIMFERSD